MPYLSVCVSVETMTALLRHAEELGRDPMDLAECAIAEAVLAADRGRARPATDPREEAARFADMMDAHASDTTRSRPEESP